MLVRSYQELADIIKQVNSPVLVITDSDLDGVCSGILMKLILKYLNKDTKIVVRKHGSLDVTSLKKIINKNKDCNSIILLDSPYEPIDEFVKLGNEYFIIYIDHHRESYPENIPENFVWFDIRSLGFEYISTTGAVYKIGKTLFGKNFEKYSLIAAIGAIGDFLFENDVEVKEDFKKSYPYLYLNSSFSCTFFYIFSLFLYSKPSKIVNCGENIIDNTINFFTNDQLKTSKKSFELFLQQFKNIELIYFSNLIEVYKAKSSSVVSNLFTGLKPEKIIIVVSPKSKLGWKFTKTLKISIRRKLLNIDVGKLLQKFTEQYGVGGGGHPEAAGGLIYKKDLNKLIEFIENKVKNK